MGNRSGAGAESRELLQLVYAAFRLIGDYGKVLAAYLSGALRKPETVERRGSKYPDKGKQDNAQGHGAYNFYGNAVFDIFQIHIFSILR